MMNHETGLTETEWEVLYQRLEKPLYNLAYRYVWRCQDAQDVVQDAFLQIWQKREQMRLDTVDRYVWTAVLNIARNRRRWSRIRHWLQIDEMDELIAESGSPQELLIAEQQSHYLQQAVDGLPEKLRAVLLLTEFNESSYDEVAQILRIPTGTVASRRNQAIKRLRIVYDGHTGELA